MVTSFSRSEAFVPKPPAKKSRPIAHHKAPKVDHRLAPLSIPSPRGPQQQHQRQPPHPPSRGLPTAGQPAARATPNVSRRGEAKALNWGQRKAAGQQRQAEKTVVNAAVGRVDPKWMASALAAAAATAPTPPPMVPLPPLPTRQAALSRLGPPPPTMQSTTATPPVGPGHLHPPQRTFQMWGGPLSAPHQREDALIFLSPPPGHRASSQVRFQGVRPDASQMQNNHLGPWGPPSEPPNNNTYP